jgi:hypothetical protein
LSSLIDNQLSQEDAIDLRDHLSKCEACRKEEQEVRTLKRLLSNCRPCEEDYTELDPGFEQRLLEWVSNGPCNSDYPVGSYTYRDGFDLSWLRQVAPATLLAAWLISQTFLPSSADEPARPENRLRNSNIISGPSSSDRSFYSSFGSQTLTPVDFRP